MENDIILFVIILSFIVIFLSSIYLIYHKQKHPTNKNFEELKTEANEIKNDNITSNDENLINYKLDIIMKKLEKLEETSNNTASILFILIISTCIILYFTYKWTYLIQPEQLKELNNTISDKLNNLLK